MIFGMNQEVGNARNNRPEDVFTIKRALSSAGYFDMNTPPEPHGYITRALDESIRGFQKDAGLKIDG